ncbi:MAG: hypothetical protein ACRERR_01425 [Moraxellaceae bacterium]
MKLFSIFIMALALTGCISIKYDANDIKIVGRNWESTKSSIEIGEVKYIPSTGIGERSIAATGTIWTFFSDISIDADIKINELVHTELNRALSEVVLSQNKNSLCVLNVDVYYIKLNRFGGSISSTLRYSLLKDGAEKYKAKIDSNYLPDIFAKQPSEAQKISSAVHKSFNELVERPQFKSTLATECQS